MNNNLSDKDIEAINQILAEETGVSLSQIVPEARIQDDLGADSLTIVEILMKLEERFDIIAPDEAWEGVSTVSDLYETVGKLLLQKRR